MFEISKWSFKGGDSGALNHSIKAGFVSGSGGRITLTNPEGEMKNFAYAGMGAGIGVGLKIGKYKLNFNKSIVAGKKEWWAAGTVFMGPSSSGELTDKDFLGACAYVDGGFSLFEGINADIFLCGIEKNSLKESLIGAVIPPANLYYLFENTHAIILSASESRGIQVGAGASISCGYIW